MPSRRITLIVIMIIMGIGLAAGLILFNTEDVEMPTGKLYVEKVPGLSYEQQKGCNLDDECIPKPGCHATECLNSVFAENYKEDTVCESVHKPRAAYSNGDCLCVEHTCVNKNNI